MTTEINNSTTEDIDEIFRLYRIATDFQKAKSAVHWPEFDRRMVLDEILENRQWKIEIDGKIACVWATTFSDPLIWEEKNEDPALYIHRIATDPDFRGQNLVAGIVRWAKDYAVLNRKKFIRMDTVGENKGLISYYEKCGFKFLGLSTLKNTEGLPAHYDNATVCLFEMKLD
ncbi:MULTISPECIES: GNAT family N-acetyltransferase [Chryseobacterium]|uniref:Ribosomal protein S18 acetylase RimI-like enzyme n=1 Tax=Chryseobacterium camelliae TaxID=1265445 RepID=A0ABU0TGF6_9FLAO|nr:MULTISPECIES: GNAT family N-acetyltransferase [Chryseobacterium]MDT3406051.1 ribosomal protein S18 acetylase RimI-like enzyme [Pseudacidovorax intermedius]MDQ1096149.1 ribosomal protein S18 acetylase RimI-like enzyme [Chryseobacterium camelliae]MDQ1100085.1 ribosomal protein S18 acetylase RimI-like enzyme [Chryseobacterium sp. SORGH_AS_1048]MDR6087429.1 ribosomal protein S18 acetylase RimI-like enzyme [Chryseobacterium sp. SORGH_AS_0909]MDR6131803.1 ribosomal protein S18 acetylase RimI-like